MSDRTILVCGVNFGLAIVGIPPTIIFGTAYTFTFKAFSGSGPYKYAEIGTLPSGITFTDNGDGTATLAGTSMARGNYPISVQLSDNSRTVVSANYTLAVVPLPLTLSGNLPTPSLGVAITPYTYTAGGGYGGYTYAITAGSLPAGLTINPTTGTVSGTATTAGPYAWTVTLTDSNGGTVSLNDSTTVAYATLTITGNFSNATLGSPMGIGLTISGGNGVYTLGTTTGTLPPGSVLTLSGSSITDTGATTTAGTDSFTVHVTSGDGQSASKAQTVSVTAWLWDSAKCDTAITLSSGNAVATLPTTSGARHTVLGTVGRSTGKYGFAFTADAAGAVPDFCIGLSTNLSAPGYRIFELTASSQMLGVFTIGSGADCSLCFNPYRADLNSAVAEYTPFGNTFYGIRTPGTSTASPRYWIVEVDFTGSTYIQTQWFSVSGGVKSLIMTNYNGSYGDLPVGYTYYPGVSILESGANVTIDPAPTMLSAGFSPW